MNIKKLAAVGGLTLGMAISAVSAQAAVTQSWSFEDDDIDFVLDPRTLTPKTSGPIAVGDVFVSVFEIPEFTIDAVNGIPSGQELTGVAVVQLQAIVGTGVGAQYVYSAYSGGLNAILALGGGGPVVGGAAGEGALVSMWFNGTGTGADIDLELNRTVNAATNCASLSNCIEQASLGTLVQVDGFKGDADEYWRAVQVAPGGGDLAQVLALNNALPVSIGAFSLSTFYNMTGTVGWQDLGGNECAPGTDVSAVADGCAQFVGSFTLTGGDGLSNGAVAHSDFDANKLVSVPEPGVLSLLGAGLLGMGLRGRKRKS